MSSSTEAGEYGEPEHRRDRAWRAEAALSDAEHELRQVKAQRDQYKADRDHVDTRLTRELETSKAECDKIKAERDALARKAGERLAENGGLQAKLDALTHANHWAERLNLTDNATGIGLDAFDGFRNGYRVGVDTNEQRHSEKIEVLKRNHADQVGHLNARIKSLEQDKFLPMQGVDHLSFDQLKKKYSEVYAAHSHAYNYWQVWLKRERDHWERRYLELHTKLCASDHGAVVIARDTLKHEFRMLKTELKWAREERDAAVRGMTCKEAGLRHGPGNTREDELHEEIDELNWENVELKRQYTNLLTAYETQGSTPGDEWTDRDAAAQTIQQYYRIHARFYVFKRKIKALEADLVTQMHEIGELIGARNALKAERDALVKAELDRELDALKAERDELKAQREVRALESDFKRLRVLASKRGEEQRRADDEPRAQLEAHDLGDEWHYVSPQPPQPPPASPITPCKEAMEASSEA